MAVFVLFIVVIAAVSGSDLPPFLAWSNENSISQIGSTVDDVVSVLGTSDVSTVIVFAFDKLSFDDIAKYGGAYGSQNELTHLQSSMDSAPFQYYGGMAQSSREWVSDLGNQLKKTPYYVAEQSMIEFDLNGKFVVVPLSSKDGFRSNDAVIGRLMEGLSSDGTYFAICTELPPKVSIQVDKEVPHVRSARSATNDVYLQEDNDEDPGFVKEDCQIGGQFNFSGSNSTSDNRACMLFCLSSPITFYPDSSNTNNSCTLRRPYQITYNCSESVSNENDTDETVLSAAYGKSYPSVTLNYNVRNGTYANISAFNNCTDTTWDLDFGERAGRNFEDFEEEIEIELTFFFPINFTYNNVPTKSYWAVMISSVHELRYVKQLKDSLTKPPDKDIDDIGVDNKRVLLIRNNISGLYQKFEVPSDNSYACSGAQYSHYVAANYTTDNETFDVVGPLRTEPNDTYPSVQLTFIQVQPYNVTNASSAEFASADNCVGYFTEATWMGIISMVILIIILYLAILCAFSIQTLDQFEDPRGQTISVEKLH